jgi:large subunit ribosomal protein L1
MGKNINNARKEFDANTIFTLKEAIALAQKTSFVKFDASLDLAIKLNLDTRNADQQLRGSVPLPNGTGRQVITLAATTNIEEAKLAKANGSEFVVDKMELEAILKKGEFNFDVIVAEPSMMAVLGKFGKQLGPKGLMPNPKTGTVTPKVGKTIEEIKKGKANYRADKQGIVHVQIGKVSFSTDHLVENATVILDLIKKLKPSVIKGIYMQSLSVSASMGPAIKIKID